MKKKIVAMMLVGVMVVMNNVVAFGGISTNGNKDTASEMGDISQRNVSVSYTDGAASVYSVDIEWGNMTYSATPGVWNPEKHKYGTNDQIETDSDVNWTPNNEGVSDIIKVTNHSNAGVKATFAFDGSGVVSGQQQNLGVTFSAAFSDNAINHATTDGGDPKITTLETGEGKEVADASSVTKKLALKSKTPNKKVEGAVGKVTVTLATS